jgi:hypothetical protein
MDSATPGQPTYVIVVPAERALPVRVEALGEDADWHAELTRLIGASLCRPAAYDLDTQLWVDDNGAAHRPVNERATRYAFGQSEASARNGTDPDRPPYFLYGTVVVAGCADDTPPARLFTLFGVTRPTPS